MTWPTNITITGLTKHMVVVVGTTVEGTINIDYEVTVEVLIEVYFKVIAKKVLYL